MVILYFLQAIFTVLGTIAFLVFINGLLSAYYNRDKTPEPEGELKGDETYYLMGKERSRVNGHIVRRGPAPSGDWCLWDCQTGQMLYDYTQEQIMSKQDKLIQEAKELGWGCYYSAYKGRCPDDRYYYPRIEFATDKEIWTSADYFMNTYRFHKMYVYDDYRKDSDWIEISLNEYLSLSPKALYANMTDYKIISSFVKKGIIIVEGESSKEKFRVDYDKEIRFFRKDLIRSIRNSLTCVNHNYVYECIDRVNNALQREIRDCKHFHGDEIIDKLLEDGIIEKTDKDGQVFYKYNITDDLKKHEKLQAEYDEAYKNRDLTLMKKIEDRR